MKPAVICVFLLFLLSLHCRAHRIAHSSIQKDAVNRGSRQLVLDGKTHVNLGDPVDCPSDDLSRCSLHSDEGRHDIIDAEAVSSRLQGGGGGEEEEEEESEHAGRERRHGEAGESGRFVLGESAKVIKTEAGELRVTTHGGISNELGTRRIGLGFLTLEPNGLLLPHYVDAHCVFFVRRGRGRLTWVDNDELHHVDLERGDIYKLESGTVFHILNLDEGQRLRIFSIFDTVSVFSGEAFHNFFVGGGEKPRTVLSGFDKSVLATAFKASGGEITDVLSYQTSGGIIYSIQRNESFGTFNRKAGDKPYNIFDKEVAFSNDYGYTATVDEDDFSPLGDVHKSAFLVRLKAGALLAPHWNPRATEIAFVTKGEGEIHIVYPNGTTAATESVQKGDVFYVPQNFPVCQIASRNGPFEFVGFSTSSKPSRPQFLAGRNSVLNGLDIDLVASSYNIPAEHMEDFLGRQNESVILPGEPLPIARAAVK
ncbi:hypothetical protein KP509_35G046100 [Ceratopteris richardii]|uniref:Cupin type-1 domain-containing protein n=1 Tax=Ceratopteris richardii TaxID=49495 RepID=A0A8T2QGL0_CERRI|nr:hypothetical protein KP509_35G046100 [Ceratopteris richardii]